MCIVSLLDVGSATCPRTSQLNGTQLRCRVPYGSRQVRHDLKKEHQLPERSVETDRVRPHADCSMVVLDTWLGLRLFRLVVTAVIRTSRRRGKEPQRHPSTRSCGARRPSFDEIMEIPREFAHIMGMQARERLAAYA